MAIKYCDRCGRRTGDCHGDCPDYAVDKAFHNAELEERNRRGKLKSDLTSQRFAAVEKAAKGKRKRGNGCGKE